MSLVHLDSGQSLHSLPPSFWVREGKGKEGNKEREGKRKEGIGRDRKGREGKGRKGKGRRGKEGKVIGKIWLTVI